MRQLFENYGGKISLLQKSVDFEWKIPIENT